MDLLWFQDKDRHLHWLRRYPRAGEMGGQIDPPDNSSGYLVLENSPDAIKANLKKQREALERAEAETAAAAKRNDKAIQGKAFARKQRELIERDSGVRLGEGETIYQTSEMVKAGERPIVLGRDTKTRRAAVEAANAKHGIHDRVNLMDE